MKGSWKIGRAFGIGLFIHWSFLILPALVLFSAARNGATATEAIVSVAFVLAIFGCIVLHELGHALTARKFGIGTQDITLLPIGGVARLNRMPRKPSQELLVAIAGPAVNVVIAGALFLGLLTAFSFESLFTVSALEGSFLVRLMWTNVFLVAFNLLPSFPMDGGRVLRSLLAMRMRYDRATNVAAGIGQGMAVVFAIIGLMTGVWTLALVAVFVFLAARGEAVMARWRSRLDGIAVGDLVRPAHQTIPADARLAEIADRLMLGGGADLPVVSDGGLVAILPRASATAALLQGRSYLYVRELAQQVPTVDYHDPLDEIVLRMRSEGRSLLAVSKSGEFVGWLLAEDVAARLRGDLYLASPVPSQPESTVDAAAWSRA